MYSSLFIKTTQLNHPPRPSHVHASFMTIKEKETNIKEGLFVGL